MSIKRFKLLGNKTGYATKEELDSMTVDELHDFRIDFLTKSPNTYGDNEKRYMKEFSIYEDVRFKDGRLDQLISWGVKAKNDPNGIHSVVGGLVNKIGAECMYVSVMKTEIDSLGEFIYIIGIVLPDFSDIE